MAQPPPDWLLLNNQHSRSTPFRTVSANQAKASESYAPPDARYRFNEPTASLAYDHRDSCPS